jgi:hypothetical protein
MYAQDTRSTLQFANISPVVSFIPSTLINFQEISAARMRSELHLESAAV